MANRKHVLARAIAGSMDDHDDFGTFEKMPRTRRMGERSEALAERMQLERERCSTNIGDKLMAARFSDERSEREAARFSDRDDS